MKRAPAKLARLVADAAAVMAVVAAATAAAAVVVATAVAAVVAATAVDVATAAVASGAADRPRVCAASFGFLQAESLIPPVSSRIFTDLRAGSLLPGSAALPSR